MLSATTTSSTRHVLFIVAFASAFAGLFGSAQQLEPKEIIQRSVEVNRRDWDQATGYDFTQRTRDGANTRSYEEIMLAGSRYERLAAVDDNPLSPKDKAGEQQRFETAVEERQHESASERDHRVEKYRKEYDRDHALLEELTRALDFTLLGEQTLGRHEVYVLRGTPRAGYRPPNQYAKALTGMQGTLWIDSATFHWVKAEAEVVRPVWIYGFAARIEPGTHFELEQEPIPGGLWMPSHFLMNAKATVFLFFPHYEREDITYFNYRKSSRESTSRNDLLLQRPRAFGQ